MTDIERKRLAFRRWMSGLEDDDMTHKEKAQKWLEFQIKSNPGLKPDQLHVHCQKTNPFKYESRTAYKAYCDVMRDYMGEPKSGSEEQLKLW